MNAQSTILSFIGATPLNVIQIEMLKNNDQYDEATRILQGCLIDTRTSDPWIDSFSNEDIEWIDISFVNPFSDTPVRIVRCDGWWAYSIAFLTNYANLEPGMNRSDFCEMAVVNVQTKHNLQSFSTAIEVREHLSLMMAMADKDVVISIIDYVFDSIKSVVENIMASSMPDIVSGLSDLFGDDVCHDLPIQEESEYGENEPIPHIMVIVKSTYYPIRMAILSNTESVRRFADHAFSHDSTATLNVRVSNSSDSFEQVMTYHDHEKVINKIKESMALS